jgi:hypothetical protein
MPSKGGSEAAVRIAKADLVPTDHNLREQYADWALAKDAALAAFASSKPGRAASVQDVECELLRAENDRLGEALKELAVELSLHRGRQRSGYSARSPRG